MKYTAQEFKDYIQRSSQMAYSVETDAKGNLILLTDYAEGQVIFHEQDIVELIIQNKRTGDNEFYLHFRLEDKEHADSLFKEMRQTLINLRVKKKIRILLSCTSGMTTSYFASELTKAAETLRIDYEFSAVSFSRIYEKGFDFDVILLAPQIHFEFERVDQIFRDAIVMKIPTAVFAQYNTGELIKLVQKAVEENEVVEEAEKRIDPRKPFENPYRILTIGVINHVDRIRIGYRIYDHGKRTLDNEVLKQTFSLQDIEDLLTYIFARHRNIDAVGLAIPGVTYRGRLFHTEYGIWNQSVGPELMKKFKLPIILVNDVNAMALGYFALNENSDDIVFFFQPDGMTYPGAGIIIDGRLRPGKMHAAGEIGRLITRMVPNAHAKSHSPDGVMEIVTAGILAFIETVAPEKVVIYSKLTPDTTEIRNRLKSEIAEDYLPEIIHTPGTKRYILPGAMVHCLEVMEGYQESGDWGEYEKKRKAR